MALYSQRDVRWAGQRLGTVDGATLGKYGCYVTAQAMSATNYGIDVTPAHLDDTFTANMSHPFSAGGYVDGDLCWDGMLSKVYPDIFNFVGVYHCENIVCDLNQLKEYDAYGKEAILEVDFDHNPGNGVQTHFIRLYAYNGGDLIIDDPWYGDRVKFSSRYGDPRSTIQKAVFYTAHLLAPAPVISTPPPVIVQDVLPTPVQTQLSVPAIAAATAETTITNTPPAPVVPEYELTFGAFPNGSEDFVTSSDTTTLDPTGTVASTNYPTGTTFKLSGTFTYDTIQYYRGTSGGWNSVPVSAFPHGAVPDAPVAIKFIPTDQAVASFFKGVFMIPSGVMKKFARFLSRISNN